MPELPVEGYSYPLVETPPALPVEGTSAVGNVVNSLFGLNGKERYQTWPEKMVRSAVTLPHDVMTGELPTYVTDETTGQQVLNPELIARTQDMAGLAGSGGLAGAGKEAGVALGSGPIMQSAKEAIAPRFYSAVEHTINNAKITKATPQEWLSYLKNQPGVKQEELSWLGLDNLSGKSVTKQELEQHIADNKVELKEVVKGEISDKDILAQSKIRQEDWDSMSEAQKELIRSGFPIDKTKYQSYQLPGGENYREVLMTLPEKNNQYNVVYKVNGKRTEANFKTKEEAENFINNATNTKVDGLDFSDFAVNGRATGSYLSSHWDEPNVLAHIRMNDRTVNGKKTLHVEEIQSDWHQAGRKQGYKNENPNPKFTETTVEKASPSIRQALKDNKFDLDKIKDTKLYDYGDGKYSLKEPANAQTIADWSDNGVPNAPFKKNWDELALKRVIRHAAENGYEQVSWTPGEAQAARYDLSKSVDKVNLVPDPSGKFRIDAFKDNHKVIEHFAKDENEVASVVGKEVAEKLFSNRNQFGASTVAGQDLKVGGEGMKGFYDKMLVDRANALGKKFGAKVEKGAVEKPGSASEGEWDYKGPSRTPDEILELTKNDGRVTAHIATQLTEISRALKRGDSIATAVEKFGSPRAAEVLGGKLITRIGEQPVHVLPITPGLRDTALAKGFPLFSNAHPGISFLAVDHNPFQTQPVDHDPFEGQ